MQGAALLFRAWRLRLVRPRLAIVFPGVIFGRHLFQDALDRDDALVHVGAEDADALRVPRGDTDIDDGRADQLEVLYFPAYSPELNLNEYLH